MSGLHRPADPRLIVGPETCDDGGVYLLTPEIALVESCDVITPPADEPRAFGRIAAANALSDIYAMGGRPLTAMNVAFFPACSLPPEVLGEVLAGGQDILNEAGCCLVGGIRLRIRSSNTVCLSPAPCILLQYSATAALVPVMFLC